MSLIKKLLIGLADVINLKNVCLITSETLSN